MLPFMLIWGDVIIAWASSGTLRFQARAMRPTWLWLLPISLASCRCDLPDARQSLRFEA